MYFKNVCIPHIKYISNSRMNANNIRLPVRHVIESEKGEEKWNEWNNKY